MLFRSSALDVLIDEMREPAGSDRRLAQLLARLRETTKSIDDSQARTFVRDLAVALQASLLIRHSPQAIADAFCASRLDGGHGAFGMLPPGTDVTAIVARAAPALKIS